MPVRPTNTISKCPTLRPQIFVCEESNGCAPALTHALLFKVLDNHGHADYTCIYNIKVFGDAAVDG